MLFITTIILLCSLQSSWSLGDQVPGFEYEEELLYDFFPEEFLWGTATAAYQVSLVNCETIF